MQIDQNEPLENFRRFLFMCLTDVWHYSEINLCEHDLTHTIRINKTHAKIDVPLRYSLFPTFKGYQTSRCDTSTWTTTKGGQTNPFTPGTCARTNYSFDEQ